MVNSNAFVPTVFSFFVPGLGQLYNGEARKGIIHFTISWLPLIATLLTSIFTYFAGMIIVVSSRILISLISAVDALVTFRRSTSRVKKSYNKWYLYVFIITISFLISDYSTYYLKSSVVRASRVPTGSMEPTLYQNDYLIVDLRFYKKNLPKTGDLVVFKFPKDPKVEFIRRFIADEGQKIEIRKNVVYVDGKVYQNSAIVQFSERSSTVMGIPDELRSRFPKVDVPRSIDHFGSLQIPRGMCFVMGDNRDNTLDSRHFGPIPLDSIIGKPLYTYWAENGERIGKTID